MKIFYTILSIVGIILILWIIIPMMIDNVKEPDFKVVQTNKNIQLREYEPYIVAEVTVSGERSRAASEGFRLISSYIFGANKSKIKAGAATNTQVLQQSTSEKIAMTAPVIQQLSSEKIAMTAPVIQELSSEGFWTIQFVMPKQYTMSTLPTPNNKAVQLKPVPAKKWAAIKFSGLASDKVLAKQLATLKQFIKDNKLQEVGTPRFAFYNAPWTLPPLRRNEVMLEVR